MLVKGAALLLNAAFTLTILDLISSVLSCITCYHAAVIIGTFHILQLCLDIIRPVILPLIVLPITLAPVLLVELKNQHRDIMTPKKKSEKKGNSV